MARLFSDGAKELLILTEDVGTSGSKGVYQVKRSRQLSKPGLLVMEPELAESTREEIEQRYESERMSNPLPENEAWVEYGEDCHVVGFLAKKKFLGRVEVADLKYIGAIPKVLAAVGVLAEREGLSDNFDLALSLPLPYNEWKTRDTFERAIEQALSCFKFRGRDLSVSVKFFLCVPEGGGLAMTRSRKLGSAFGTRKIVVIMMGYRDISVVLFDRGVPSGATIRLGMLELLNNVIERTFRLETESLLLAIAAAGTNFKPKNFERLVPNSNSDFRISESTQIAQAAQKSRIQMWGQISRWLMQQIPQDVTDIVIGGGTAEYFQLELKAFCTKRYSQAALSWAAELQEDVRQVFDLDNDSALISRLTDAYGLHRYTSAQLQRIFNQVQQSV